MGTQSYKTIPGELVPVSLVKLTAIFRPKKISTTKELRLYLLDFADRLEEQAGTLILGMTEDLVGRAGFDDDALIYK